MSLQTKSFADLITLTRASVGTYLGADGLIKTAAIDVPRFDFSTGKKALLLESSATNLIKYSEDFTQSYWTKSDFTVVPAVLANGLSGMEMSRAAYPDWGVYNETAASWFIAQAAAPTPVNGRVSVALTVPAGCTSLRFYPLRNSVGNSFVYQPATVAPGANVVVSWFEDDDAIGGVQVEEVGTTVSKATSYIKTYGTAVTRAADYAGEIDLSGFYLGDGYTIVAKGRLETIAGPYDHVFQLDTGVQGDAHQAYWGRALGRYALAADYGAVAQGSYQAPIGTVPNDFRMAMAVGPDHFQVAIDGTASGLDTSALYATPTVLRLAQSVGGNRAGRLVLESLIIYPNLLTEAQLIEVTA